MPEWLQTFFDRMIRDLEFRYEMLVRWVNNWTINDHIFWASVSTVLIVGVVVIMNLTKGSRLGALRHVTSACALVAICVYGFGLMVNIQAGGMSHVFGR
ncbi:MAG: hypothetical protein AAGI14_00885 [Pseudomonadota bacterium]